VRPNGQGAVDERGALLRLGVGGLRARIFFAHLAGWGLLGIFLLRPLLRVGRWRRLLAGGEANAADKCQRARAGPQEIASHG
jgi:hypothetical protein